MTHEVSPASSPRSEITPPTHHGPIRRLAGAWQLIASIILAGGVLCWLLLGFGFHSATPAGHEKENTETKSNHVVEVAGPYLLRLKNGSRLAQKIKRVPVTKAEISTPILSVTGTVVASLRQGNGQGDYW